MNASQATILNSKELKDELANLVLNDERCDFLGEKDIARDLLHRGTDEDFLTSQDLYILAVKKFLESGKFNEALIWLRNIKYFRESYFQVYFREGDALVHLKRYEDAVVAYSKGIDIPTSAEKQVDGNTWGLIGRARSYLYLDDFNKALSDFTQVIALMKECKVDYADGYNMEEIEGIPAYLIIADKSGRREEGIKNIILSLEERERVKFAASFLSNKLLVAYGGIDKISESVSIAMNSAVASFAKNNTIEDVDVLNSLASALILREIESEA